MMVARHTRWGRRTQTSNGGNRGRCGEVARQTLWGFGGCECEYNFCDMARTLRMGENTFCHPCNFKELRVVKRAHITLLRYVPDGSLRTASVEQIFPCDNFQRNCFELALYIMTASPIASVRVFEPVRDADVGSLRSVRSQRCRCEIARSSC